MLDHWKEKELSNRISDDKTPYNENDFWLKSFYMRICKIFPLVFDCSLILMNM